MDICGDLQRADLSEADEHHYCLEVIKGCKMFLLSAVEKMPKLRCGYDRHKDNHNEKEIEYLTDLYKTVSRLKKELSDVIHALNELEEIDLAETAKKLNQAVRKFKFLDQSYDKLCGALKEFASYLPADSTINVSALGRLMNRVKMGYFPTENQHVRFIKSALRFPRTRVNILDPCCGCGTALSILTEKENADTYGVEIDRFRAEEAENIIQRVGYGSFFYSRISNGVFHCIFLNPPYMSVMGEGGRGHRAEKTFLLESIRYLATGGVLVYVIPYYRITEDICTILAENFDDIRVFRFLESEFKKFKQVVIFGKAKRRDKDCDLKVRELFNLSLNVDSIPLLSEITEGIYSLPEKEMKVKLFKGAEFNVNELALQLKQSNKLKTLFDKSKLDTLHKNPLLPLKTGQIGLIGGSGLMNGLIECDAPHITKGRITKERIVDSCVDKVRCVVEVREVISNRMTFNVLTQDGFKSLT